MKYNCTIFCLPTLHVCAVNAQKVNKKAVNLIFDSDMGPDYDDVGAITILHVLADQGRRQYPGNHCQHQI